MDKSEGRLTSCATAECGWRCCEFQQGNYIVLHPGEIEEAWRGGQSTAHLAITDEDYHGGKKAICKARDTAHCDAGFKPLDCVSYPFFPAPPGNGAVDLMIKGEKCPLIVEHIQRHAAFVRELWNTLATRHPAILAWLNKIKLVGYSAPLLDADDERAAPPHRDAA